MQRQISDKS